METIQQEDSRILSQHVKITHFTINAVGSVLFLVGSVPILPSLARYQSWDAASAWMFTVGSLALTMTSIRQWTLQQPKLVCQEHTTFCMYPYASTTTFLLTLGNALYSAGSMLFIPQIKNDLLGYSIFIVGSAIIIFAQLWRVQRRMKQTRDSGQTFFERLKGPDEYIFILEIFGMIGSWLFFGGSFLFLSPTYKKEVIGAIIFIIGSVCFCATTVCLYIIYFGFPEITSKEKAIDLSLLSNTQSNQTKETNVTK